MSNVLIEVYVPTIDKVFDVMVPERIKVYELTSLLTKIVARLAEGLYIPSDAVLCDGRKGKIYRNDVTLEEMKIKNGSRVMLI